MTGNIDAALISGQVNINQIYFTPDFDLTSFMNQFGGVATPPPTQGFADNVKLNVAVRSSSELDAVSPTVSIQGAANLRIIGTASDPVIVGRANLTGGDVIFMGNRYVVQGGTIAFVNSIETEPVVNLQASTSIQQYNISMRFRGPIDRRRPITLPILRCHLPTSFTCWPSATRKRRPMRRLRSPPRRVPSRWWRRRSAARSPAVCKRRWAFRRFRWIHN